MIKRVLLFLTLIIALFIHTRAQEIPVIKFPELKQMIQANGGDIKVINFWATWCKPCIEELPYFEEVNHTYDNVEVILVSLDLPTAVDTKVKSFLEKKSIQSKVVLLDETDFNAFIDKIDPRWSGAIPATLIVDNSGKRSAFYEKQFQAGELDSAIKKFIN